MTKVHGCIAIGEPFAVPDWRLDISFLEAVTVGVLLGLLLF